MTPFGRRGLTLIALGLMIAIPILMIIPAEAEPGTYFYGYIKDEETGDPLYLVQLVVSNGKYAETAYTNEEGYYEHHVSRTGDFTIIANANGYEQKMKEESISKGQDVRVDFNLVPYETFITGYITDSRTGDPIKGAYVEYCSNDGSYEQAYNRTDENGYYKVWLESGNYDLRVDHSQYYQYREEDVVIDVGEHNHKDVILDPFDTGINGYVYNENGDPIEGAVVKADNRRFQKIAIADEDGYYSMGLDPGKYKIVVYKSDYYSSSQPIELEEGEMKEMDWTLQDSIPQNFLMKLISWITGLIGMI